MPRAFPPPHVGGYGQVQGELRRPRLDAHLTPEPDRDRSPGRSGFALQESVGPAGIYCRENVLRTGTVRGPAHGKGERFSHRS